MVQEFRFPTRNAMRVLDALNWIAENVASDLAYRWFCGSKMCGTCAVRMNGREVLACWEAVEPEMTIEPLRNLPVIRDLVVDRAPFDRKVAEPRTLDRAHGALCRLSRTALAQGHEQRLEGSRLHRLHGCYSACPVVGLGDLTNFAGPAPLVQLGQTALDPRNDPAKVARALAQTDIFSCISCYKCEEVCPASIPIVTRVIEPLKAQAAALVPAWQGTRNVCDDRGGARPRRSRRARARRAGLAGLRNFPRIWRCSSAARSTLRAPCWVRRLRRASAARAFARGRGGAHEACVLPGMLGAQHLRRAQ